MAAQRTESGRRPVRRFTLWLAALATLCVAAAQKRKPAPPAVQILEVAAHRSERLITIDGKVRNVGGRPLKGLELILDFMTSEGQVITRQRGAIEAEWLDPGEEAEFRWQMRDHARAVSFQVRAVDGMKNELPVKNAGPHYID